ncbi:MAG: lactate utilization protein [Phycisphaeraceae bacterium]|nr:MAG: lactate utilization protein [Phycisphaeraceae bacterium]
MHLNQFHHDAAHAIGLGERREFIREALHGYERVRAGTQTGFGDWEAARLEAARIKWDAIEHLDEHLVRFADNLEANGAKVFWAATGEDAVGYVRSVCRERGAKRVIKSKTMTSEEIHLNEALEADGIEAVESDLGEFIVQLRKEPPYHFVFPSMHLERGEIRADFERELHLEVSEAGDDPETLTMIARRVLREMYLSADVGVSGANFGVAETGSISITENEGNARLTTSMPPVHVCLIGIEKVIPRLDDLALLLPMLATAGTGQHLTCYNSLLSGPRRAGECDGPEEMHVVLLDNGRTELLADPEQRDALRCIRCGACLNVCPIFKNVGGFTYGTTYQGPIGSVITPHLRGAEWAHLSSASTLCGACSETCPVRIDLHHHLLRNRRDAWNRNPGLRERVAFRVFAAWATRPGLYGLAGVARRVLGVWPRVLRGTALDPARAWRRGRDLPESSSKTFKAYWKERSR